ncbi:protein prenylyltransferase [Epithele typhae]|uniref:protein prenylyltransferase n=1 Tax=Epithele typhae TaxID=378194 RepID=UPI0020081A12|nr:protein prenylyltransferase [Epithele typhae]KAH9942222.1 protein prenylyltransferase [Epithele typhae]
MSSPDSMTSRLGRLLSAPPISIELLPGDRSDWAASTPPEHAPFLFIERNLGIPQKLVYRIYIEAGLLLNHLRPRLRALQRNLLLPLEENVIRELHDMSAILLVVNPAHHTALNARKTLILGGHLSPTIELGFTNALLTLRDGSKQSTLWHHRRWLLRRIHQSTLSPSPSTDGVSTPRRVQGDADDTLVHYLIPADALQAELDVTARACELYERNYHAWAHRAVLLSYIVSLPSSSSSTLMAEERRWTRAWLARHVADYSAAQYACQLEAALPRSAMATPNIALAHVGEDEGSAASHALSLVRSYPTHETLWLYLRGALSGSPSSPRSPARLYAEHALAEKDAWTHAVRFLAWVLWQEGAIKASAKVVRRITMVAEHEESEVSGITAVSSSEAIVAIIQSSISSPELGE